MSGIPPLCDMPSGCCSFTGPWTVTRSSLRMLRWVAAFCRPLWPVLLLVEFPRSRSPVFGVLGLCRMWQGVPFARQRRPIIGVLRMCWLLPGSFDCFCCPHTSVHRLSIACLAVFPCGPGALFLHALSGPSTICAFPPHGWSAPDGLPLLLRKQPPLPPVESPTPLPCPSAHSACHCVLRAMAVGGSGALPIKVDCGRAHCLRGADAFQCGPLADGRTSGPWDCEGGKALRRILGRNSGAQPPPPPPVPARKTQRSGEPFFQQKRFPVPRIFVPGPKHTFLLVVL